MNFCCSWSAGAADYCKNLEQGFLLLEDFGDVLLSTLLNEETVDQYYLQSFKQLVQLQSIDGKGQFSLYSQEKLLSEMQLLTDWMLPALSIVPSPQEQKIIDQTFKFLSKAALSQPQVIVHRDFHSRNLMKLEDGQELGIIDFQDAVIGADTYDRSPLPVMLMYSGNQSVYINGSRHFMSFCRPAQN